MARAALKGRKIGEGPRPAAAYIPAASVLAASLLDILPIVATNGWFPEFGFLMLLAWRLLRSDVWPAWWAAPMGLFNDIVTGSPIGLSVTLWTGTMLLLDLIDRRTMWKDYWIDWGLAGVLVFAYEVAEWQVASAMGAPLPFSSVAAPAIISIFAFPVVAWTAARLDSWRLGR